MRGGGCSGFQYHLAFDEQREDDRVFESHGMRLLVEPEAFEYVDGSQIDYIDALTGAGFKVENPNVVAACGCGSSFRVAGQESCSPVLAGRAHAPTGDRCMHRYPGRVHAPAAPECVQCCACSSSSEGTTIGPSGGWVNRIGLPNGSRSAQSVP